MLEFVFPKHITPNYCHEVLNKIEEGFNQKSTDKKEATIDLTKIKKSSLLGVLIFYKFLEYCVKNNCFLRSTVLGTDNVEKEWARYGFTPLLKPLFSNKSLKEKYYNQLDIQFEDKFIVAPQPLLRENNNSKEALKYKFLPQIRRYYKGDEKKVSMIFSCLSEIILNFWEHARKDTHSIIVAYGTKDKIEIACADTGEGLISNLKNCDSIIKNKKNEIIKEAVKLGITSKDNTNHMGYGLFMLDQFTRLVKGKLHIFSEGVEYRNSFGKILTKDCGFWQGTIVYINLPLRNPVSITDIEEIKNIELTEVNLNWK